MLTLGLQQKLRHESKCELSEFPMNQTHSYNCERINPNTPKYSLIEA